MNVRYYLIAVLFILFDIEVVFFLPWAVSFRTAGLSRIGADFDLCGDLRGSSFIRLEERSVGMGLEQKTWKYGRGYHLAWKRW